MLKLRSTILILFIVMISTACFAKQITGNVQSIDLKNKKITVVSNNNTITLSTNEKSKLYRSLVGTSPLDVDLLSISPGDAIAADVNASNVINTATAKFNIIRGTIAKITNNTLLLSDGKKVSVSTTACISLDNGQMGKVSELVPGHTFVARTNPNTGDIWTLVVSGKVNAPKVPDEKKEPVKTTPTKQTKPEVTKKVDATKKTDVTKKTSVIKPVAAKVEPVKSATPSVNTAPVTELIINSFDVSAPKNLNVSDLILVRVTGTIHAGVSAELQYVPNTKTKLSEDTPGVYTGLISVPSKDLNKARFIAYISKDNKNVSKIANTVLTVKKGKGSLNTLEVKVVAPVVKTPEKVVVPNTTPAKPVEEKKETVVPKSEEQKTETKEENDNANDSIAITPVKEPVKDTTPTIKIDEIKVISPLDESKIKDIFVQGIAIPDSTIFVRTTYSNDKTGVLSIKGLFNEETIKVGSDGIFTYGPIELTGYFATSGLSYYIQLSYTDNSNYPTKQIKLIRE